MSDEPSSSGFRKSSKRVVPPKHGEEEKEAEEKKRHGRVLPGKGRPLSAIGEEDDQKSDKTVTQESWPAPDFETEVLPGLHKEVRREFKGTFSFLRRWTSICPRTALLLLHPLGSDRRQFLWHVERKRKEIEKRKWLTWEPFVLISSALRNDLKADPMIMSLWRDYAITYSNVLKVLPEESWPARATRSEMVEVKGKSVEVPFVLRQ
jgi:hypothetical protein